jgi:hypothetical protein
MKFNFSLSRITPEINQERLRSYRWIVLGQVLICVVFLFVHELFFRHPFLGWQAILIVFIGGLMLAMNVLTYVLLKDLTDNSMIRILVLILLWTSVLLGIISSLGWTEEGSQAHQRMTATSMLFSLMSFFILLYFMFIDIFKETHEITYRLWGCACIYLLIGSTFGLLFSLMEIYLPEEFLINTPNSIFHFIPCYNFSFYNLAGIDSPYENFSLLVRNVAVIESLFSNLYIVLVVGRLLSK